MLVTGTRKDEILIPRDIGGHMGSGDLCSSCSMLLETLIAPLTEGGDHTAVVLRSFCLHTKTLGHCPALSSKRQQRSWPRPPGTPRPQSLMLGAKGFWDPLPLAKDVRRTC